MPEEMERALRREVEKKHPNWSEEKKNAWVYGILRSHGWKPKLEHKKG